MNHIEKENPLNCPVVATLKLIQGKWKPMIIHSLKNESMRFGQLKRALHSVSQKVLTQQLRELEDDGLIVRTVNEDNVVTVTYSLSLRGESLVSIIDSLYVWGEGNL